MKPKTSGIITVRVTAGALRSLSKTGEELKVVLVAVCNAPGHRSTTVTKRITLRRAI